MASDSQPIATGTELKLTAPDPVPEVAPERAAGLVPVGAEVKSKLAVRVDQFVEDLVREEIRPLLKSWLDQHLPPIVERLVQAEIERVVARQTG